MDQPWQKRAKPPSTDEINAKAEARLIFMEDELKKRGIHIAIGAEQEFIVLDKRRKIWTHSINHYRLTNDLQLQFPLLERVYNEELSEGEYEAVFSSVEKVLGMDLAAPRRLADKEQTIPKNLGFYPSVEIARQIVTLRRTLSSHLNQFAKGLEASFRTVTNDNGNTTAGMHINSSCFNQDGKNLFFNKRLGVHSPLALQVADIQKQLQEEGTILYAPKPESYDRFGKRYTAPRNFMVGYDKADNTLTLRYGYKEKTYRIEDRMAGADANPYLVMLASVGAIYSTIIAKEKGHTYPIDSSSPSISIKGDDTLSVARNKAYERFSRSELWQEIAGEDLYRDLLAYMKPCIMNQVG